MSRELVKYWALECTLRGEDSLTQDQYDDSDWEKVYKAEDVARVLEDAKELAMAIMRIHSLGIVTGMESFNDQAQRLLARLEEK